MDATDATILELLQRNARITQAELGRRVGLSQPSIADRIRRLEEERVILGWSVKLDPKKVGKDITAFIGVGIEHPRYFQAFAERVAEMDEVLECHRVVGHDSYLLKVRTEDTAALDTLLVGGLRTLPGVTRTYTTIVLASEKEETLLIPRLGERP